MTQEATSDTPLALKGGGFSRPVSVETSRTRVGERVHGWGTTLGDRSVRACAFRASLQDGSFDNNGNNTGSSLGKRLTPGDQSPRLAAG